MILIKKFFVVTVIFSLIACLIFIVFRDNILIEKVGSQRKFYPEFSSSYLSNNSRVNFAENFSIQEISKQISVEINDKVNENSLRIEIDTSDKISSKHWFIGENYALAGNLGGKNQELKYHKLSKAKSACINNADCFGITQTVGKNNETIFSPRGSAYAIPRKGEIFFKGMKNYKLRKNEF